MLQAWHVHLTRPLGRAICIYTYVLQTIYWCRMFQFTSVPFPSKPVLFLQHHTQWPKHNIDFTFRRVLCWLKWMFSWCHGNERKQLLFPLIMQLPSRLGLGMRDDSYVIHHVFLARDGQIKRVDSGCTQNLTTSQRTLYTSGTRNIKLELPCGLLLWQTTNYAVSVI